MSSFEFGDLIVCFCLESICVWWLCFSLHFRYFEQTRVWPTVLLWVLVEYLSFEYAHMLDLRSMKRIRLWTISIFSLCIFRLVTQLKTCCDVESTSLPLVWTSYRCTHRIQHFLCVSWTVFSGSVSSKHILFVLLMIEKLGQTQAGSTRLLQRTVFDGEPKFTLRRFCSSPAHSQAVLPCF
jgi:hypothetical protein